MPACPGLDQKETARWGGGPFRGGGMLLYFGSRRIMHQGNTCLCDSAHI
jgi:hypothetical protein